MAVLPQTSLQGGPNPNSAPGLSVADLPGFGGTMDAALTGGARAAAIQAVRSQIAGATGGGATYQPPAIAPVMGVGMGPGRADAIPLPAFNPADPSLVQTPANGVSATGTTGLGRFVAGQGAQYTFNKQLADLQNVQPTTGQAIHNWMFNKSGSPEAAAYDANNAAGAVYNRPEAGAYFGAHPSLIAHAAADPVGFATKLGPVLDAAVAASNGTATQGHIAHATPDGPMLKPDNNVEQTRAVAQGFGISDQHSHALTQTHAYTLPEFLAATEGLPRGALKNMWEMQHYLNPQQQALSLALSQAGAKAQTGGKGSAAQAEYERMLQIAGGVLPSMFGLQPAQGTP